MKRVERNNTRPAGIIKGAPWGDVSLESRETDETLVSDENTVPCAHHSARKLSGELIVKTRGAERYSHP